MPRVAADALVLDQDLLDCQHGIRSAHVFPGPRIVEHLVPGSVKVPLAGRASEMLAHVFDPGGRGDDIAPITIR